MTQNTLLLRVKGPMQSWGRQSRFSERDTQLEPTLSGIVGLIGCALGKPREESSKTPCLNINGDEVPCWADMAALRMGVRVDQEGTKLCDFQTTRNVYTSKGEIKPTEVSNRYYLADANFLIGLESDNLELLERLHAALQDPVWLLYLGRKAFPPAAPIAVGVVNQNLEEALRAHPWTPLAYGHQPTCLRAVLGTTLFDDALADETPNDVPLCFEQGIKRAYTIRRTRTLFWEIGNDIANVIEQEAPCTFHV